MKFCPMCSNIYTDKFETCLRDQTALQMLPPEKSKTVRIVRMVAAVFVVVVVLPLLVIHQVEAAWKKEDQTSAINSLKQIHAAETQYRLTYPERGYSCSLWPLGGDPAAGPPTADAAQLLDPYLAADAVKLGYQFSIADCSKETASGHDVFTSYKVVAVPLTVGKTGDRGFCLDQDKVIKFDSKGGIDCTEMLQ
jgi:type IV pilus assembly protein PilA